MKLGEQFLLIDPGKCHTSRLLREGESCTFIIMTKYVFFSELASNHVVQCKVRSNLLDIPPPGRKYFGQGLIFFNDRLTDRQISNSSTKFLLMKPTNVEQHPLTSVTTRDALVACDVKEKWRHVFFLKRSVSDIDLPGSVPYGKQFLGIVIKIHIDLQTDDFDILMPLKW